MQRFARYRLSIEILKCFQSSERGSGINRYNLLGGRTEGDKGTLEDLMNVAFSDEDRIFAGQVLSDIQSRGLIAPTYRDLASPGDWLKITPKGSAALKSGAIDELDNLLLLLNSPYDLISMRYGMYDAMISQHTDWQRHAATSGRELITKILHTVASDEKVKNDKAFVRNKDSKSEITRSERIKFYLRNKKSKLSESDFNVCSKACNLIEACYEKLSAITHSDLKEVEAVIKLTEDALFFLLSESHTT